MTACDQQNVSDDVKFPIKVFLSVVDDDGIDL